MKKVFLSLLILVCCIPCVSGVSDEAFRRWHGDKYSMFIHFGLYSRLGGVWNGEPVRRGYSEQIQSFAGIFSDWYGETALEFDPVRFDADSIAALARRAGMRSVVFTSKHHDGFCMFSTETTDYNSAESTPSRRDFVREMAEACSRAGLKFGIYFSLIDWHFPHAYPISSHNCDFITPQHHEFSKAQVRELLTNYGPISEFWFDMGCNTPSQSRELYDLVRELQPDCMVSGRLGNDCYDFCVMADNAYPDGTLATPWQSAASMFNETWGYRSWQERGAVGDKVAEKLRNLVSVVSHGGNFLLNIGPTGTGEVVPFEAQVLERIGEWLDRNGDAIYDTEATPFREDFPWGMVTRRGENLYLILTGERPRDGKIRLPRPEGKIVSASVPFENHKGEILFALPDSSCNNGDVAVIRVRFDRPVADMPVKEGSVVPRFSYSCFDFATNYQSIVSYDWHFNRDFRTMEFLYTPQEEGKSILAQIDGKDYEVQLSDGKKIPLKGIDGLAWGGRFLCKSGEWFDTPAVIETDSLKPHRRQNWTPVDASEGVVPSVMMDAVYVMQDVVSPDDREILIEIGGGTGVDLFLNGHRIMKHLNPYGTSRRDETVALPLKQGRNRIVLRSYNRFGKENYWKLSPAPQQHLFSRTVRLPEAAGKGRHIINVRQQGLPSANTDTELSNLRLSVR